jgi:hypothetical protein
LANGSRIGSAVVAATRSVGEQQNLGRFLAAQSLHPTAPAQWRAASRDQPPTIARQRDRRLAILFTEKAAANHAAIRIQPSAKRKAFSRLSNESGYISP